MTTTQIDGVGKDDTGDQMGRALRQARLDRGWSLDEVTFQLRDRWPELRIGRMKIARLEKGHVDRDRIDVRTVIALAELYELRISQLDSTLAGEIAVIGRLARTVSPCNPTDPDGGRWNGLYAA